MQSLTRRNLLGMSCLSWRQMFTSVHLSPWFPPPDASTHTTATAACFWLSVSRGILFVQRAFLHFKTPRSFHETSVDQAGLHVPLSYFLQTKAWSCGRVGARIGIAEIRVFSLSLMLFHHVGSQSINHSVHLSIL